MKPRAFQMQPQDNVATLLDDAMPGNVRILGAAPREMPLREKVECGHKMALYNIAANAAVIKFGLRIGHATQPIAAGTWVHLHNLASDLDERSATLNLQSGAPTDTASAYV